METKRTIRNKNIMLLIIAALIAVLSYFTTSGVYSFLTSKSSNEIRLNVGSVNVSLVEESPFDDANEIPDEGVEGHNKKTFWGVANGSKDTVVRAKITPLVEYRLPGSEEWVTFAGKTFVEGVDYTIPEETKQNWIRPEGSDYWYYNNILEGNKDGKSQNKTEKFYIKDIKLEINEDDLPVSTDESQDLKNADFRLNMIVDLESSQASNKMPLKNWAPLSDNEKQRIYKILKID